MRLFNSARKYHQLTRFSFNDVKSVYHELPSVEKSEPVKHYENAPVISLPGDFQLDAGQLSLDFTKGFTFRHLNVLKTQEISLQQLSQLLHLTNGVTLTKTFGSRKISLRAAPSASASYPVEIYVAANRVRGLSPGLYYYHPINHQLQLLKEGNRNQAIAQQAFGLSFISGAPVILLFTGVFSRNFWRYQDRAFRYSLQDAGYIFQNLVLAASSLNLAANLVGDFDDQGINGLLNLDNEKEGCLMVAVVGEPLQPMGVEKYTFAMPAETEDHLPEVRDSLGQAFYTQSSHFYPGQGLPTVDVTLPFQKSSSVRSPVQKLISLPSPRQEFSESTFRIISRRRSAHNYLRIAISLEDLSTVLHYSHQIPSLYNYPAFSTYLVIHDVQDLPAGLYLYHPENHQLELLKKGTFRGDISYLTLAQDAVFNCSVAFFFAVDFSEINLFSNRGYRYAHFNVGMLSESIYLTATALELGARGIGNFFDDDIGTFFQLHSPDEVILGGVIVGKA